MPLRRAAPTPPAAATRPDATSASADIDADASAALAHHIAAAIRLAGGWLPFDAFMDLALYAPGLGYYAHGSRKFGWLPGSGSDFVTAPELSPLFAEALAAQVAQSLAATGTREVWEFGAGSGALADALIAALDARGAPLARYTIVDVSAALAERQRARLARWAPRVAWAQTLPPALRGVVIGNEVLDAMPVKLLARRGGVWHERGVRLDEERNRPPAPATLAHAAIETEAPRFVWEDRPSALRPPVEIAGTHDYVSEIHPRQRAFVRTLAETMVAGGAAAAFFIDYGFPEAEYWHPERSAGTLVCHRAHRVDDDPLTAVGEKDITAHVDFTGVALAAQDAGLDVLGYTGQGRFLINCGLPELLARADLRERAAAMKLIAEHEMGELFKVIGLATPGHGPALGFAAGDRTHRL